MRYCLLLAMALSIISLTNCEFNPEKLEVVDKNEKFHTYLVRGNLPIGVNKNFQIEELKANLTIITGLQNYRLIIVSFLNFLTAKQTKNRYIEEKFFEKNPSEGEYRHKIILGSLLDPFQFPKPITKFLQFTSYFLDIDNIDSFLTELHQQVHQKGRNKIIFFHCSAGMDRTGYVAGSYQIKYLNYNMNKVIQQNSRFGGVRKHMHFNALNGLKWFCLSQKLSRQQCTGK